MNSPVTPIGFMWLTFCASLGLLVGNVWLVLTIGSLLALVIGIAEAAAAQKRKQAEAARIMEMLKGGDELASPTAGWPTTDK